MWLKEAEDVTWDRFLEGLTTTEQTELAERVKDKLSQYNDPQKSIKAQPLETKEREVCKNYSYPYKCLYHIILMCPGFPLLQCAEAYTSDHS